jgi:hypothetical protein
MSITVTQASSPITSPALPALGRGGLAERDPIMQEKTYLVRKWVFAEPNVAVDAEYLHNMD